jgi:cAMP-dependent protein kinase regulator
MNSNFENFYPKLRPGRVIPHGSHLIFETDKPYNQIILPMSLADLVLLCGGSFSVREIVEKIYKKQGFVPFRSVLTAIHLLHEGGFFENGDELTLSSNLQTWMGKKEPGWQRLWTFKQSFGLSRKMPMLYYAFTLGYLLCAILGLQHLPLSLITWMKEWHSELEDPEILLYLISASTVILSTKYLVQALQSLLLSGKTYNFSLRLNYWGLHLHVGDEASALFNNRLFSSMYHVSQIIGPWVLVFLASQALSSHAQGSMVVIALCVTAWELNPFRDSHIRKLIRKLMIPQELDLVAWHFEQNPIARSINTEARVREDDLAKVCTIWGMFWLIGCFYALERFAIGMGPLVLNTNFREPLVHVPSLLAIGIWLAALFYLVQASIESLWMNVLKPYGGRLLNTYKSLKKPEQKNWTKEQIVAKVEGLPLFSHLPEASLLELIGHSELNTVAAHTQIIHQGEPSKELYVLLEGEAAVVRKDAHMQEQWITDLSALSVFGESSLVEDVPRASDVVAKTTVTYLRVPAFAIRKVATEAQTIRHLEVFKNAIMVNQFFASSPVFRSLSSSSIDFLCSRGTLENFGSHEYVFHQGDTGDSLYLILRGSIEVLVHENRIKSLTQGSFFGEIALLANIPRTASIQTIEPCVLFKISSDAFWEILVQHMDLGLFIEAVSEIRLAEDLAMTNPNISKKTAS